MFRNLPRQTRIFPCQDKYSTNAIAIFENGWAGVKKSKMIPFLVTIESQIAQFFDPTMGRPIKYISLLIVLHILKEMYNWTDAELVEQAGSDKRFEYAFELSFQEVVVCQKTLHDFRHLLLQNELARTIFERAAAHIITTLNNAPNQPDWAHPVFYMRAPDGVRFSSGRISRYKM